MVHRFKPIVFLMCCTTLAFSQGEMKLSLEQALKTAVERNLDLQLERLNVDTSKLNINATRSRFDPIVSASLSTRESKSSAQTSNEGSAGAVLTTTGSSINADVKKSEWFGFDWSLSSTNSIANSNRFNSLGETFETGLDLSFRQQLLKGFSLDKEVLLYDRYIAFSNDASSRSDLVNRMTGLIQNTENAYWDLVLSLEQLEVNKASLELALSFLEQNKTKVEVGTLPPIDLINAETQVANRELQIVSAENSVRAAEDALKKIMNLPMEQWSATIVPTDRIHIETIETNFETDLETALKNRPEMIKDDQALIRARIDHKVKENELLPSLTFSGGYGFSGSSQSNNITRAVINPETGLPLRDQFGNTIYTDVGVTDTSWRDALSDLATRNKPGWNASLAVSWSPFNTAAKVNIAKANIALRQLELQHEQTRVSVLEEVRAAVRDLQANIKSIQASEKSVKLSRENLKATEQKFQNGLATNYVVAEKQKDLVQEETNLIQTKINYIKSTTKYYKALGKLMERRNIIVQ